MNETITTPINDLLKNIVIDNPTFPFPVNVIREELIQLFINQFEFDYFLEQCIKKLKSEHHIIFANTFLLILEEVLDTSRSDVYDLPNEVYQTKIDYFISKLETLNITRIDKKSPDGEMLSIMKENN
jgi:hypothetical protein